MTKKWHPPYSKKSVARCSNTRSGEGWVLRGSLGRDGKCSLHERQPLTSWVMSLSIPGQYTERQALRFVRSMPWWLMCRVVKTSLLIWWGITRRQPLRTRWSSTASLSLTDQYGHTETGRSDFWCGKPSRVTSPSWVYFSSFSANCANSTSWMSFSASSRLAAIMAWRFDWILESAKLSSGAGSSALDRASASVWDFPGYHDAWKLYPIRRIWRRWRRGFSISPRWCLLRIVMRGLWSVMMSNWLKPSRKMRHLITAQATASISSSIMTYIVSLSVRNLEPACIRCHLPLVFFFCLRTNPRPHILLASVWRAVGQPGS